MTQLASIAALAFTAALVSAPAHADDTHVLTPHYPDAFKVQSTRTTDSEQIRQGQEIASHTKMVFVEAAQKTASGYRATLTGVSFDGHIPLADGQASPGTGLGKRLPPLLTAAGPVEVTFDKTMAPLRIDNIDAVKSRIKAALTGSGDARVDAAVVQLYDTLVANLTPETAAAFLKQASQAGAASLYNRPLPLHTPMPLSGDPIPFMGASLHLTGTVTLDEWNDGQSATISTVLSPTDADLHGFMTGFVNTLMSKMMTGDQAQYKPLIDRILDNMRITMTVTCHSKIDLGNYALTQTTCDTTSAITLDIAKALPPEVLKQKPEVANMPPMSLSQVDHTVSETHLIP